MRDVDYAAPRRNVVKITCDLCGAKCISDFAELTWHGISPEANIPRPFFGGTFRIEAARPVNQYGVLLHPPLALPFSGNSIDMCQPCILRVAAAILTEANTIATRPFQMLEDKNA